MATVYSIFVNPNPSWNGFGNTDTDNDMGAYIQIENEACVVSEKRASEFLAAVVALLFDKVHKTLEDEDIVQVIVDSGVHKEKTDAVWTVGETNNCATKVDDDYEKIFELYEKALSECKKEDSCKGNETSFYMDEDLQSLEQRYEESLIKSVFDEFLQSFLLEKTCLKFEREPIKLPVVEKIVVESMKILNTRYDRVNLKLATKYFQQICCGDIKNLNWWYSPVKV